jgi:hypothetical protein
MNRHCTGESGARCRFVDAESWPFSWSPPASPVVHGREQILIVDTRGMREGLDNLARAVEQCREGLTAFMIEAER